MTKLALLDGHSLAYRAFYALPPDLATPSGQVTNAVFGFTSMLIKLLDDEAPDAMAVAWDRREPTFRSEKYPEYKATRESAPDLFRSQVPIIKEVLDALQIPQVSVAGFEADDVIATLVGDGRDLELPARVGGDVVREEGCQSPAAHRDRGGRYDDRFTIDVDIGLRHDRRVEAFAP